MSQNDRSSRLSSPAGQRLRSSRRRVQLVAVLARLALIGCLFLGVPAAAQCQVVWARAYGGNRDDLLHGICQCADGQYAAVGRTKSLGPRVGQMCGWVLRLDAEGESLWSRTYVPHDSGSCLLYGAAATDDSGLAVVGHWQYNPNDSVHSVVIRLDKSGGVMWFRELGSGRCDMRGIQKTRDGGFMVAGLERRLPPDTIESLGNGYAVRLDRGGAVIWDRCYGGLGSDDFQAVDTTNDGGFAYVGRLSSPPSFVFGWWLLQTDSLGEVIWSRAFVNNGSWLYSVRGLPEGGVAAAGSNASGGGLVRVNDSGQVMWERSYGGYAQFTGICQAPDGDLVCQGHQQTPRGDYDLYQVKVSLAGELRWEGTFDTPLTKELAYAVQATQDGGIIIAGIQWVPFTNLDGLVVKTGKDGLSGVELEPATRWQTKESNLRISSATVLRRGQCPAVRCNGVSQDPLRIDLFAANGRRIWQAVPKSAGAGWQTVYLPSELPAGVYCVRLQQSGRSAASKIVITE